MKPNTAIIAEILTFLYVFVGHVIFSPIAITIILGFGMAAEDLGLGDGIPPLVLTVLFYFILGCSSLPVLWPALHITGHSFWEILSFEPTAWMFLVLNSAVVALLCAYLMSRSLTKKNAQ